MGKTGFVRVRRQPEHIYTVIDTRPSGPLLFVSVSGPTSYSVADNSYCLASAYEVSSPPLSQQHSSSEDPRLLRRSTGPPVLLTFLAISTLSAFSRRCQINKFLVLISGSLEDPLGPSGLKGLPTPALVLWRPSTTFRPLGPRSPRQCPPSFGLPGLPGPCHQQHADRSICTQYLPRPVCRS